MRSLLFLALFIFCGRNSAHCSEIKPSSQADVEVKENWPSNELVFTWDPEYFKQYFKPGAKIMVQATVYIAETDKAVYTACGVGILRGGNGGNAKIFISNANKDKISKSLHYYVLKPVGTQSNVYLSSGVIKSTFA